LNIHSLFKRELSNISIADLFEHLSAPANSNKNNSIDPNSSLVAIGLYGHKDGIIEFLKSFTPLLNGLSEFLSKEAYIRLVACSVDKVVVLYMFLLREVYESHHTFIDSSTEFQQIKTDIVKLKHHFSKVTPTMYVESLMHHFRILDQVVILIGADINCIKPTILELQHEAEGNPGLAEAIATMIHICLELRPDYHEIAIIKRQKERETREQEGSHTRRKTFMGMFASASAPDNKRSRSPSPTPDKVKPNLRSSSPAPDVNPTADTSNSSKSTHRNSVMSFFRRKSKDSEANVGHDNITPSEHVILALESEENEEKTQDNSSNPLDTIESPLEKLVNSFDEIIVDIRAEYDNDILNEDIQLSSMKPVYSVFSNDIRVSALSLSEILFKSSSKSVRQKLKMISRVNVGDNKKKGLFSWGLDNKNTNAKNSDNVQIKEGAPKTRSNSSLQTLVISEVRATSLFGLESMRQPKFSFEFSINGEYNNIIIITTIYHYYSMYQVNL